MATSKHTPNIAAHIKAKTRSSSVKFERKAKKLKQATSKKSSKSKRFLNNRQKFPRHKRFTSHGLSFLTKVRYDRDMLKDFKFESIPTFHHEGKAPSYTYSDTKAFLYDEASQRITILERVGIEATPEEVNAAGPNIESLKLLPSQPIWFPDHIKEIFTSDRYPDNVSFTVSAFHGCPSDNMLMNDRPLFNWLTSEPCSQKPNESAGRHMSNGEDFDFGMTLVWRSSRRALRREPFGLTADADAITTQKKLLRLCTILILWSKVPSTLTRAWRKSTRWSEKYMRNTCHRSDGP